MCELERVQVVEDSTLRGATQAQGPVRIAGRLEGGGWEKEGFPQICNWIKGPAEASQVSAASV